MGLAHEATEPWTTASEIIVGRDVNAISMRAGLGAEVHHHLILGGHRGTLFVSPGQPPRWVFLTGPSGPIRVSTLKDLLLLQVAFKPVGSVLALPPENGGTWVVPPASSWPFPWYAVLTAARRTTGASW